MGIGTGELIVILIIVLIIFGAGKIPEVMKALGKGIKEFKDAQKDGGQPDSEPPEKTVKNESEEQKKDV